MRKILYMILAAMLLTACKKEIDFDFNEIDPVVVIVGKVSNEGSTVTISRSRSVTNPERAHCLPGALVTISCNGTTTALTYDMAKDAYYASLTGIPGETYQLSVDFEGRHYEGSSQMPKLAPIISSEFMWMSMLGERMLCYELWAVDPNPSQRDYLWFQMHRTSKHPHFVGKLMTEPFSWNVFDDRGCPPGTILRDMMSVSERTMDKDEEENWKRILYEGDSVYAQLMTIDRTVYEYLSALRAGQNGSGANPRSNITGGCLGYFAALSISRTDTIEFHRSHLKER